MFFIHEKEANSILTISGIKHLVAVTPSFVFSSRDMGYLEKLIIVIFATLLKGI